MRSGRRLGNHSRKGSRTRRPRVESGQDQRQDGRRRRSRIRVINQSDARDVTSAASKFPPQYMSSEFIAAALLESEGYAAFEYLGDAAFQIIGTPSKFCLEVVGESAASGVPVRLTDRMPFLESFLPDAEECWESGGEGRVDSGSWIERGVDGRELALEASAFRIAGKRIMLIRNPQRRFADDVRLLQKARE